jgi:hypothetical protein
MSTLASSSSERRVTSSLGRVIRWLESVPYGNVRKGCAP